MDSLIAFTASKSGGQDGKWLNVFARWHSIHVPGATRRVCGSVYGELANFKYMFSAYAILKTAYTCSQTKVVSGLCTMISSAVIQREKKKEREPTWAATEQTIIQALCFFYCGSGVWRECGGGG